MSSYIIDSDLLTATSSVSIPFYYVYLPSDESISAGFVYNYYTRDEGVSEAAFTSLDAIDADSDQYAFVVENWEEGVYPRQVNLTFTSGNAFPDAPLEAGVLAAAVDQRKVVYEDAPFENGFSSIIVHDTSIDSLVYESTRAIRPESRRSISDTTRDFLNVQKLQSAGLRFSKAQTRQEITALYDSDVKSLNLGISLNNFFVNDVVKTSSRWQSSVFSDEFAYTLDDTQATQRDARESAVNPFSITENEIDIQVDSIYSTFIRADVSSGIGVNLIDYGTEFASGKVGYIIEKYGEQIDGSTLRYPDIIIEDPSQKSYLDPYVRYGGVYKYRVRTVYRTTVIGVDESDLETFEGYDISVILFATTGEYTTVQCVEKIPPQPPINISFQQTLSGLYIRWNFPINTQKDIKRFQVFRRESLSDPFELLKEINFDKTILPYTSGENVPDSKTQIENGPVKHYLDNDFFEIESDYIYALCCIDAHGYSSSFSEQFRVRFDKITGKLIITRVSPEGAPKPYPNVKVEGDFFDDLIKDSGHSRVRIYFDPEYLDVTRDGNSLSLISQTGYLGVNYRLSLTEINLGQNQSVDISITDNTIGADGIPVSIAKFYSSS
jgi:hypothetical protein